MMMAGAAILMLLLPAAFFLVGIGGCIVFLVAAWNFMRAHESVAASARHAVGELRAHVDG